MINDSIRQVLMIAVSRAADRGEKVIDADAEIARLGTYYPATANLDVDALRSEIASLAQSHGLAVQMGSR